VECGRTAVKIGGFFSFSFSFSFSFFLIVFEFCNFMCFVYVMFLFYSSIKKKIACRVCATNKIW
jgi:hypothetical protein